MSLVRSSTLQRRALASMRELQRGVPAHLPSSPITFHEARGPKISNMYRLPPGRNRSSPENDC
ncbi:hypothetical protein BGZ61DRAFT_458600 [Ilyonectria robusta]|uniref:uncharacterized protein n=1 Tax=Ilyonectria robusta TaxID=1079257 RepID=UPI001E8D7981|nr:uncharacterized protein BGZ61DRAFT_458600 [Ilyonectria robusta]KAH8672978.1 hypothetical protein BGZ61DRAFT_458600 [Ilyonectria robusta]